MHVPLAHPVAQPSLARAWARIVNLPREQSTLRFFCLPLFLSQRRALSSLSALSAYTYGSVYMYPTHLPQCNLTKLKRFNWELLTFFSPPPCLRFRTVGHITRASQQSFVPALLLPPFLICSNSRTHVYIHFTEKNSCMERRKKSTLWGVYTQLLTNLEWMARSREKQSSAVVVYAFKPHARIFLLYTSTYTLVDENTPSVRVYFFNVFFSRWFRCIYGLTKVGQCVYAHKRRERCCCMYLLISLRAFFRLDFCFFLCNCFSSFLSSYIYIYFFFILEKMWFSILKANCYTVHCPKSKPFVEWYNFARMQAFQLWE